MEAHTTLLTLIIQRYLSVILEEHMITFVGFIGDFIIYTTYNQLQCKKNYDLDINTIKAAIIKLNICNICLR